MKYRFLTGMAAVAGMLAFASMPSAIAALGKDDAPLATPPGVTIQGVLKAFGQPAFPPVLASTKGMTLYTYDNDKAGASSCVDACAAAWPPFLVEVDSKPSGNWSTLRRADGARQWTYKGKALYTSTKDEKVGEIKGNGVDKLWHAAFLQPELDIRLPAGIGVKDSPDANGYAFVDWRGMTLYAFSGKKGEADGADCGDDACMRRWTPLVAPAMARTIGDFTVVKREDETLQWAYAGKPLFTYSGDAEPGAANGHAEDARWNPVLMLRYFKPSEVEIRHNPSVGPVLAASVDGRSLYMRDRSRFSAGGHNLREMTRGNPETGRRYGLKSCNEECAKEWHPLIAPANAQSSGYWDVVMRPDGNKQWAYRGYALYTYVRDKNPNDKTGNDIYDLVVGDDGPYKVSDFGPFNGGGALYWHVVHP